MRKISLYALYLIVVSIFLTIVQPCYAQLACVDLFEKNYSVETSNLAKLFEDKLTPYELSQYKIRWKQLDIAMNEKKLSWEKLVVDSSANASAEDRMTEINGYRIGSSNTFRSEPNSTFALWWAADRLLLELSHSDRFISLESFKRVNEILNAESVLRFREYWDDFLPTESNPKFKAFKAIEVERGLNDLIVWYHSHKNQMHPIELAAQFAQRFITIHPFKDGNGRTARLFMDRILIVNGYLPVASSDSKYMRSESDNDTSLLQAVEAVTSGIEKSLEIMSRK